MKKEIVQVVSTLLLLMFVISGGDKVFTLGKSEAGRLMNKLSTSFNTSFSISQMLVLFAGIWELISCVILLYGIWSLNSKFITIGSISLAVFTILATLIFYTFPFKKLPFLSNLTTLCALILLPYICLSDN